MTIIEFVPLCFVPLLCVSSSPFLLLGFQGGVFSLLLSASPPFFFSLARTRELVLPFLLFVVAYETVVTIPLSSPSVFYVMGEALFPPPSEPKRMFSFYFTSLLFFQFSLLLQE